MPIVFKPMLFVALFAATTVLFGCSETTHLGRVAASADLPPCNADGTPGDEFDPSVAVLDMRHSRSGEVRVVDGKPFKPRRCNINRILLQPGTHIVYWSYKKSYSYMYGPPSRDIVGIEFTAEPDGKYDAVVILPDFSWRYECSIRIGAGDTSSGLGRAIVTIDDCDRDQVRRKALDHVLEVWGGIENYNKQYELLSAEPA